MRHLVCLLYWYDITNTTCFTGTKVQILTAVSGHIAETIQGVAVVKAFKAEERYTSLNKSKLQEMQSAAFTLETLQMWLSVSSLRPFTPVA